MNEALVFRCQYNNQRVTPVINVFNECFKPLSRRDIDEFLVRNQK